MRMLVAVASILMIVVAGGTSAQDWLEEDAGRDVLDFSAATEPGCFSSSYVANGFCWRHRAEKADRWLKAVFASCLAKANETYREKLKAFPDQEGRDESASLRRAQDSFERFREDDAKYMYDSVYPGMLAGSYHWQVHYQLTVDRARALLGLSRTNMPSTVDLTKTDWCN